MAFTPLNSLNSFLAVARRRSFAAAARDHGVSTSALSQSVRQLEERLGVTLLNRTSRSVALTDAGQRLLETAGPAVDQALESLRTVTAVPGEVRGRVRLTVPTSAVSMVLKTLLPHFFERYPKVEVDVHVEDRFVDMVAARMDAGIRLVEAIARDMVHVRLTAPFRIVVVGAPKYFERHPEPMKPADLLQHDCLCMRQNTSGDPWAWELERGKKDYRVPVRGSLTTNNFDLRRAMALAGKGLLYAMEPNVADDIARRRLRVVLEEYAPAIPGLFLYFPSRAQVSPALKAFIECARDVAICR